MFWPQVEMQQHRNVIYKPQASDKVLIHTSECVVEARYISTKHSFTCKVTEKFHWLSNIKILT